MSGSDLFKGEVGNVSALAGVLDGDAADVATGIEVEQGVFIEILGLLHRCRPELDM